MRDGHVHSKYCPHGTRDTFEQYLENALKIGLKEITFTEHLPLPINFKDPSPKNDSAMKLCDIDSYINDINNIKEKYKDVIKINLGFEVDFIEGYEEETKSIIDKYGVYFDDAIISVHMIKIDGDYHLIDYSVDEFEKLITLFGGINNVYNKYYETVKKALDADLGKYKPKRIGHLNLVRKFNKIFPYDYSNNKILCELVKNIKEKNYELDYNISGKRKEHCEEAYISGYLLDLVKSYDINMVLGSDSHCANEILCQQNNINLIY